MFVRSSDLIIEAVIAINAYIESLVFSSSDSMKYVGNSIKIYVPSLTTPAGKIKFIVNVYSVLIKNPLRFIEDTVIGVTVSELGLGSN